MQEGLVVLSDGAGGAYFAWHDSRGVTVDDPYARDIYLLRLTSGGAIAPGWPAQGLAVCTAPNSQWWPQLARDDSGGVLVFWQDDRTGQNQADIMLSAFRAPVRSPPAGRQTAFGCAAPIERSTWPEPFPTGRVAPSRSGSTIGSD